MSNGNSNEDIAAARRRALANALKNGEAVAVSPTGEVGTPQEMEERGLSHIEPPQGKLA